jgi:uncharacterized protein YbjQ (UPF0145 family)
LPLRRVAHYRRAMANDLDSILISTINDVPGYDIVEVFGLVVRARNILSNIGASLRTLVGGEVGAYTQLLTESRLRAVERLRKAAAEKGANAVIAMRFDCSELPTS